MNPPTRKTTPPPAKHGHDHDNYRAEGCLDLTLSESDSPPAQHTNSLLQQSSCYTTKHYYNNRVSSNNNNNINNTSSEHEDMLLRSNRVIGENANNGIFNSIARQHFSNIAPNNSNGVYNNGFLTNNQNNNSQDYNSQNYNNNSNSNTNQVGLPQEKIGSSTQQNDMTNNRSSNSAAGGKVIANRSKKFLTNDDTILQSLIREEKPVGSSAWETVAKRYNLTQNIQRTAKQLQKHFTDSIRRARDKPSGSTSRPSGAQAWLELHDELEQHYAMQTLGSNHNDNNNNNNKNNNNQVQNPQAVTGMLNGSASLHYNNVQQPQFVAPQITNNFAIYSPNYNNQGTFELLSAEETAVSRHTNKRTNVDVQLLQNSGNNGLANQKKARLDQTLAQMLATETTRMETELGERKVEEHFKQKYLELQTQELALRRSELSFRKGETENNQKLRQQEIICNQKVRQQEIESNQRLRQQEIESETKLRQEELKVRQEELQLLREQHRLLTSLLLEKKVSSHPDAEPVPK